MHNPPSEQHQPDFTTFSFEVAQRSIPTHNDKTMWLLPYLAERSDVKKEEVLRGVGCLAREDTALHSRAVSNSLVGVDAARRLLALVEVLKQFLDLRTERMAWSTESFQGCYISYWQKTQQKLTVQEKQTTGGKVQTSFQNY